MVLPAILFGLVSANTVLANLRPDARLFQIAVQPLGRVESAVIAAVVERLESEFEAEVVTLAPVPMPVEAFYSPRQRYRADKLLAFLDRTVPVTYPRIIAVTSVDISVTKGEIPDWGVFGYAILGGRVSIISTFRLSRKPSPTISATERLQRVAVHEVGHLLGLEHCPSPVCVMRDCQGSIDRVDTDGKDFCPICRKRIQPFLRSHL